MKYINGKLNSWPYDCNFMQELLDVSLKAVGFSGFYLLGVLLNFSLQQS